MAEADPGTKKISGNIRNGKEFLMAKNRIGGPLKICFKKNFSGLVKH
jgi:hypothetical protein